MKKSMYLCKNPECMCL
ncbi:unnamed protein product [Acanthoscelides obtectus]|uniref:Uncharacterized protein n=1 Tax=Acanthoscelides obtectus TaxID=200917 RepID=A0A9P0P8Y2_ACAOB|nr:unnamed protein product [Acanthoscelides obtectus]CAK1668795.1 hypothetical protein AOBTE_LOCUS26612 [Acanthoscelides obtectus]